MPQFRNRHRHSITDLAGDEVEGVSNLEPPPSLLKLVQQDPSADAQWKKWLNIFYEYIGTLNQAILDNMSKDFYLEVSKGNVTGHSTVNKFGASISIADGTTEEIWDGAVAYTWPTTASITTIKAGGDDATMRGMVVEVQGVDTDYVLTTQDATLDGADSTTEVALATALRRVFRMKVKDPSVTTQTILVGPSGFASTQGQISIGNNQTLMALYTVPADKTAYVTNYYASIIGEASPPATIPDYVLFRLWSRDNANGYAPQLKHELGTAIVGDSTIRQEFAPYFTVTEKSDIYMTAFADGDDAYVSAGFDLILVDNA